MICFRYAAMLIGIAAVLIGCGDSSKRHYQSFSTPAELQAYLSCDEGSPRLISAHRGGPEAGFPENAIETFDNVLKYAPCLIECDVRLTSDGVPVLLHDERVDRTTTGNGALSQMTLSEIKQLRLVDRFGKTTPYQVPTLHEALTWAKDKAILQLDIKGNIKPELIVEAIEAADAEAYTVVIASSVGRTWEYQRLNPHLMISVNCRSLAAFERLKSSNIDTGRLLAFTGVFEPDQRLYRLLHSEGICAILGTMGNLDRRARQRGKQVYRQLMDNGADIIATDDVALAASALAR